MKNKGASPGALRGLASSLRAQRPAVRLTKRT